MRWTAGAVVAEQAQNLAPIHFEGDVVKHVDGANDLLMRSA